VTSVTDENESIKLPTAIKGPWLAALRSGDYQQGSGALLDDSGCYCCLGVLACAVLNFDRDDVFGKEHLTDLAKDDVMGKWSPDYTLPYSKNNPDTWVTTQRRLAGLNDSGKTFSEIADWIEENL